jgi:molybdenum cofactor synthesis domain-containing protein
MQLISQMNWEVSESFIVRDDRELISEMLRALVERGNSDLILTTGGTGFSKRDVTPEATRDVIEREAPGIAEAMRLQTAAQTRFSMLSRGVAGIRGDVLIINLPGSTKGVRDCFNVIAPVLGHALELLKN